MKVFTDHFVMVQLDYLPFNYHIFSVLLLLQYHTPSLRLEGREIESGKPVRVPLMSLRLEWNEVNSINI
jgi:hypothetical protein